MSPLVTRVEESFSWVSNDGTVVGKRLDQSSQDRIHEAAVEARDIGRYRIQSVTVAGREVIGISVERRIEGFAQTSNGRVLVRRGARNVALFGPDLIRLVNERSLRRFELTNTGLPRSQADPDPRRRGGRRFEWSRDLDLTPHLEERGLLDSSGHLTIAGALFLTEPGRSMRQNKAIIEVRRYPEGSSTYDRRQDFSGPLHRQVAGATEFISSEIGSDVVITGLYRHDLPRLPQVVIREAIANAVAHRSYEAHGTAIVIDLRRDAVVVTSPGGLPEPVTVDNLRQAQAARNQHVIDVLRRFRLAEDAGRGVDVMQDSMEEALLDPPRFEDLGGSVRVTLPLLGAITARERAWVSDLERRGEIHASDRLLLVHSARGEKLTNGLARDILRVGAAEARESLQRLRDAGLIVQHGTRGGASYTLIEELAPPAAFRMTPAQIEDLLVSQAEERPLTNEIVREITGLGRKPAVAVLNHLVKEGRLRRHGSRRGTRYTAA